MNKITINKKQFSVKNTRIPVILLTQEDQIIKYFASISECASYFGIARSTVRNKIKHKRIFSFNW